MHPTKPLSLNRFFGDPVIRNIYDSPKALRWLVDEDPPSLPSPSDTFPSVTHSVSIRSAPNTKVLYEASILGRTSPSFISTPPDIPSSMPTSNLHTTHSYTSSSIMHQQQQSSYFIPDCLFDNEVSSTVTVISLVIDGIALGYSYDSNTSFASRLIDSYSIPNATSAQNHTITSQSAPISKKWAAILYNHEIMTLQLAKYPTGTYLAVTGCSDYATASYVMNYYLITDFPKAIPTTSLIRSITTFHSQPQDVYSGTTQLSSSFSSKHMEQPPPLPHEHHHNHHQSTHPPPSSPHSPHLRDHAGNRIPSHFVPILGKGYGDRLVHLVFHCSLVLDTQCPRCALARIPCTCPAQKKQSIPEWCSLDPAIRNQYAPSIGNFLAKLETVQNTSFFTTVLAQTPRNSFYIETFSDILNFSGRAMAYDYAKAAYLDHQFTTIFKPRIRLGLFPADFADPDHPRLKYDDESDENDHVIIQKEDLDEIFSNPAKFFISLKISLSKEKRKKNTNSSSYMALTRGDPTTDQYQAQAHINDIHHDSFVKDEVDLIMDQNLEPNSLEPLLVESDELLISQVLIPTNDISDNQQSHIDNVDNSSDISPFPEYSAHQPVGLKLQQHQQPQEQTPINNNKDISSFAEYTVHQPIDIGSFLLGDQANDPLSLENLFEPFQQQQNSFLNNTDSSTYTGQEYVISSSFSGECSISPKLSNQHSQQQIKRASTCVGTSQYKQQKSGSKSDPPQSRDVVALLSHPAADDAFTADNQGRFPCPQCNSSFKERWHLTDHVKFVHAGIKNHKCDLCQTSFARKGDRNKHIRLVHEKLRKHKCDDCGHSYSQKADLNKHRRSKHNEFISTF